MNSEVASASSFELADIVEAVRRRARLIGLVTLPIALLGVALATALPDVYRSSALFELEQNTAMDANRYERSEYAERYVYSLRDDVLSSDEAGKFAHELLSSPSGGGDGVSEFRHGVDVEMVTARILDPREGIERDINTGFVLSYDNHDPEKAAQGASWLAQALVSASRKNRAHDEQEAANFLAEQADRARSEISQSEARLAEFKKTNVGRLPELAGSNLDLMERTQQELNSIEQQLAGLRQTRAFLSEEVEQLKQAGPGEEDLRKLKEEYQRKSSVYSADHPDVVALRRQIEGLDAAPTSSTGRSLTDELAAKKAILVEARQRYSDDHPDVRRLNREIDALQARIDSGETGIRTPPPAEPALIQSRSQLGATDSQVRSLERRSAQLSAQLADLQARVASTPEVERNYFKLTRDTDNARKVYDELMNQKMEADIRAAAAVRGRGDQFRIVGTPQVPGEPAEPARMAIGLASVLIGVIIALSAALVAEMLDSSVRGSRDLARLIGTAPVAVVPEIANSVTRSRTRREMRYAAAGLLIAVPLAYFGMRALFGS